MRPALKICELIQVKFTLMTAYRKKDSPQITLEGQLERITYFSEDTHYTIARLKPSNLDTAITVVGYLAGVSPGETIKVNGTWKTHRKYGQQFNIQSFEVTLPAKIDGIREYLASGTIKGIGPAMASKLIEVFGVDTLEVIECTPERLLEVEGIGNAGNGLKHCLRCQNLQSLRFGCLRPHPRRSICLG